MWVVLLAAALMFGVAIEGTGASTSNEEDSDAAPDGPDDAQDMSMPNMPDDATDESSAPTPDVEDTTDTAADEGAERESESTQLFSVGSGDTVVGSGGDDVFLLDPDPVAEGTAGALASANALSVDGGAGDDQLLLSENGADLSLSYSTVSGGSGDDLIVTSGVGLTVDGGDGADRVETPVGSRFWDSTIQGGTGDDVLDITIDSGGTGDAQVLGGAGNDLIDIRDSTNVEAFGGEGNDTIQVGPDLHFAGTGYVTGGDGGAGDDLFLQDADIREALQWRSDQTVPMQMTGGEGADTFQLTTTSSDGVYAGYDGAPDVISREWMSITDFEVGTDMIVFDLTSSESGVYSASTAQMVEDSAAGQTQVSVLLEADGVPDQVLVISVAATGLDWDDVRFVGAAPTLTAPVAAVA